MTLLQKATFKTALNADTTEWCPIEEHADIFVCGTYQLSKQESPGTEGNCTNIEDIRLGRLYLFKFAKKSSGYLKVLQEIPTPGILDSKWCHVRLENKIYLALVNAIGELRLLQLCVDEEKQVVQLKEVYKVKITTEEGVLLLSLDWSTGVTSANAKILVSNSIGQITVVSFRDGCPYVENTWSLHSFEAWIVACNYWNTDVFFSGGDDCKMKSFDIRSGQTVQTNKSHNAGVTSMHMNFQKEYDLISGSYDEYIRFWDVRNMKTPRKDLATGGGIWRLKWEPKFCKKICASCMYFGSVIVDATQGEIIAEYKEHTSINYGIDWCVLAEDRVSANCEFVSDDDCSYNVLSVCSFYDNLLSLVVLQTPKSE